MELQGWRQESSADTQQWAPFAAAAQESPDLNAPPTMLKLHYFPGNASMTPHMLLEELGVPYELELVDRTHRRTSRPPT